MFHPLFCQVSWVHKSFCFERRLFTASGRYEWKKRRILLCMCTSPIALPNTMHPSSLQKCSALRIRIVLLQWTHVSWKSTAQVLLITPLPADFTWHADGAYGTENAWFCRTVRKSHSLCWHQLQYWVVDKCSSVPFPELTSGAQKSDFLLLQVTRETESIPTANLLMKLSINHISKSSVPENTRKLYCSLYISTDCMTFPSWFNQ
jgi:hypothetical protein